MDARAVTIPRANHQGLIAGQVFDAFRLFGKESNKLQLRSDFFNVFNHANLSASDGYMNAPYPIQLFSPGVGYNSVFNPAFEQALYGVSRQTTGLTAFAPLAAQQRQIQLYRSNGSSN